MTDSGVAVRQAGDDVVIRVAGRATAVFGPDLREYLVAAQARGVRRLVVDLGECVYMDSTFIGVLTMAAVEGRKAATAMLLANAGPAPRGLLAALGVEHLFTYADSAPAEGPWEPLAKCLRETAPKGLQALGQTALQAHEALSAANPENVPRFKDVIACLRREAQQRPP